LQGEAGHDRGILAEQEREAMNDASRQEHWEHVYTTKGESEVSWFQENATASLELMTLTGATPALPSLILERALRVSLMLWWRWAFRPSPCSTSPKQP
jgi:hypothetical protein